MRVWEMVFSFFIKNKGTKMNLLCRRSTRVYTFTTNNTAWKILFLWCNMYIENLTFLAKCPLQNGRYAILDTFKWAMSLRRSCAGGLEISNDLKNNIGDSTVTYIIIKKNEHFSISPLHKKKRLCNSMYIRV